MRWGLVVADMTGRTLVSIRPDERFTPASNVKIATTMAGFAHLEALETSAIASGLTAHMEWDAGADLPNIVLVGGGDALVRDGADCTEHCLRDIAVQIATTGLTEIGDVVGDDRLFPDERWAPGWSQEDLKHYYGTAVSALTVNDNELWLTVEPGANIGDPATLTWREGDALYALENDAVTVSDDQPRTILWERAPGSTTVRVYGTIPRGSASRTYRLGIDDPALFAAMRLRRLLEAEGITVSGRALARHRPMTLGDFPDFTAEDAPVPANPQCQSARPSIIAELTPTPLADSLEIISKRSQNLHAELVLRRLGLLNGTGARAFGLEHVDAIWAEAGVTATGYAVTDGSGLSIYNRISPAGMVQLLLYASEQDWFSDWKATLPIGGIDGTLARSFNGTELEGKIFAKTGTLNGVNALSGYMIAASGRELVFSLIANDRPNLTRSAIAERDAALLKIAEAF